MPWVKGQTGNPKGRPLIIEAREIKLLAQKRTPEAFKIIVSLMKDGEKDSTRLAAAIAVLKIAGVPMDASGPTVVVGASEVRPYSDRPTHELMASVTTTSTMVRQ
jgi:hypothetical protein